jgi:hypothetical protein
VIRSFWLESQQEPNPPKVAMIVSGQITTLEYGRIAVGPAGQDH